MSKEKAVLITLVICIVLMLLGIAGILFMPNIKEWFKKPSEKTPVHNTFNESASNITINQGDDFDIKFQLNGEKFGEGWMLSSDYSKFVLSIMNGDYLENSQSWTFYGKNSGSTVLVFEKGAQRKTFNISVR